VQGARSLARIRRTSRIAAALAAGLIAVLPPAAAQALPWLYTATPTHGSDSEWLTSVSAAGPGSAWAVGSRAPETAVDQPIALHWNGGAWTSVAVPHTESGGHLEAVSTIPGTSDAWAVGTRFGVPSLGMALRWHAGRFTSARLPWTVAQLYAVRALGPSVAFAAGVSQYGRPLVARFQDGGWHQAAGVGILAEDGVLRSIAVRSPTDVWAVGHHWVKDNPYPLLLHYDGTTWRRFPVPNIRPGFLRGVAVVPGTRQAWAVGADASPWRTVIMRFDGKRWARVSHPEPGGIGGGELNDVAAAGPNKAWAVGQGVEAATLIWNGYTWRETTTPRAGEAGLNGISRVPGSLETFAAGFRAGHTYAVYQR
jgi:hypothetical protein